MVAFPGQVAMRTARRTGEWTYWYKNGQQKAHGAYARGKLHGSWVWYRAGGGPLQAGSFVRGLQDGPWTRHHASGELIDRGVHAAGKKIGIATMAATHVTRLSGSPTRTKSI